MIGRFIAAAALATLAGCASSPQITAPKIVKVPVSTPCLHDVPTEPAFATDAQILAGSGYQSIVDLRIDREARKDYEQQLRASMAGCQ
jgi:hypothetical protein